MENAYRYAFEVPNHKKGLQPGYERLQQFVRDTSTLLDLLQESPQKPMPILAPLLGRTINLTFSEPLSPSVLEQVAARGYICRDASLQERYVSDQAAA